ncbi:aldo/keto reductase [Streptomyces sp. SID13031]|uniref:aldo/keto reductase n=1 Tax=Streptomyces sp. SID13031 TaxID=2706046 RepID=UPI0013C72AD6|nr:aldo/keto reductase [Streptomyces sp. SID13031]NEA35311.1 aldo/keto reductase [Streptomyces sp. SID13031]
MQTTLKLSNGAEIPVLGLGVWQVPDGPITEAAVTAALETGYRLIDTAQAYGNEASVGRAIRNSGVPREEIFLTTKFHPGRRDPLAEIEKSLELLDTEYVDLYLVHWPQGGATVAWPGMEAAHAAGLAKGIGVSNFSTAELTEVSESSQVAPMANQFQYSPFVDRRSLVEACVAAGVVPQGYSPLGTGEHLDDPAVAKLATATGRTPAQVLIRWSLQRGVSVIPKSSTPSRIKENFVALDFELDDDSMAALDALDATSHTAEAKASSQKWWS